MVIAALVCFGMLFLAWIVAPDGVRQEAISAPPEPTLLQAA
jgi:archaellum component FlaF (FlaF/FlaG flagellin family)